MVWTNPGEKMPNSFRGCHLSKSKAELHVNCKKWRSWDCWSCAVSHFPFSTLLSPLSDIPAAASCRRHGDAVVLVCVADKPASKPENFRHRSEKVQLVEDDKLPFRGHSSLMKLFIWCSRQKANVDTLAKRKSKEEGVKKKAAGAGSLSAESMHRSTVRCWERPLVICSKGDVRCVLCKKIGWKCAENGCSMTCKDVLLKRSCFCSSWRHASYISPIMQISFFQLIICYGCAT